MSAFKNLRDVSHNFETDLRRLSTELFSAKVGESFDDALLKKLRDLTFYTSKLRLLRAKPIASNPQIAEQINNDHSTIQQYEETATTKVLEQQIVKFLTQSHAVKSLITTPSRSIHPELVERKEKIIESLSQYRHQESQLRHLDSLLREREEQLASVRAQWDKELGELRDMRDSVDGTMEVEPGPLHKKLRTLVGKMELMRWLISKLVTSRSGRYDWLADPRGRLAAMKLARENCSFDSFISN